MFWDRVAGVYDIFANIINRKANRELCNVAGEGHNQSRVRSHRESGCSDQKIKEKRRGEKNEG